MPWVLWEALERPNKHQLLLLQEEGGEGSFDYLRSCDGCQ